MKSGVIAFVVLSLSLASPALAQMMDGGMMTGGGMMMGGGMQEEGMPMGRGMGMGPMGMMGMMGGGLRGMCRVDLGTLGLPADVRKALEDRQFELRKTAIRKRADLRVLRLELHHLLRDKGFDLAAAQQKAKAVADAESDLRAAHLAFLHELASKLTDAQWQKVQEHGHGMMRGGMMRGAPGSGCGMMPRRQMMHGGQMMRGGMMMPPAEGDGGTGHHSGSSPEAEKFFENE